MQNLKIVFMGTSDFAVPTLRALCEGGDEIVSVVTQPDRPSGRGLAPHPSPVKSEALLRGMPVFQPEKIRLPESVDQISSLAPDLVVVAAYGQILPKSILDLPRVACLNVHASLLPRHRGAAPIHRAIMEGDRETGVSIMHMSEGLDEGDVVLVRTTPIGPDEDTGALHDRLALMGADALMEAIPGIVGGTATRSPQDPAKATYAPSLKREHCVLDWSRSALRLHDQVRGLCPWPVAETRFRESSLRLYRSRVLTGRGEPGIVLSVTREGIEVAAGEGSLLIQEIQPPGKKRMGSFDFTLGHPEVKTGYRFQ